MPLLAVRGNGPAGAYGFGAASGAPAAMTAIASTTISSTTTSFSFSSIPSTYDDLMLVFYGFSNASNNGNLTFNSDSSALYSSTLVQGTGSAAESSRESAKTSITYAFSSQSSTTPVAWQAHILNYANTTNFKTVIARGAWDNNGSGQTRLTVGLYRSTSAISSLTVTNPSNFTATSIAALYGIKKAA